MKSYTGGSPLSTLGFSIKEQDSKLTRRIEPLETNMNQLAQQELPVRQRELETRKDRMTKQESLPSFGSTSSENLSLEQKLAAMESMLQRLTTDKCNAE